MKQYFLLALSLVLGDARAEEPKECIDKIVLDIQMDRIENQMSISHLYYTSDESMRNAILEVLVKPIRRVYEQGLKIPLEACWHESCTKKENSIYISYTTTDNFLKGFSTAEEIEKFLKDNAEEDERYVQELRADFAALPQMGNIDYFSYLKYILTESFKVMPSGGLALLPNRVFIFSIPSDDLTFTGYVIAHELGHIFGLEHATNRVLADGNTKNIMYKDHLLAEPLGFSDEDKAKILSQFCKPEETK